MPDVVIITVNINDKAVYFIQVNGFRFVRPQGLEPWTH